MKDDKLKKIDEELMNKTASLRERKINPKLLDGFAASVDRKIASRKELVSARSWGGLGVAVPVFAVLVLAVLVSTKQFLPGNGAPLSSAGAPFELAQLPESIASAEEVIADEVETLRELGVWTNEDEASTGVSGGEEEEMAEVLG